MKFKLVDCTLRYNDDYRKVNRPYLCAVGKYDENDEDCKEWDDYIFYWFESEEDIKESMKKDNKGDFTIIDYIIKDEE